MVKPGDIVKVKVLDIDIPRKRISLTLRLDDEAAPKGDPSGEGRPQRGGRPPQQRQQGGGQRQQGGQRGGGGGQRAAGGRQAP
ncbi:RNA-binding transcriptional accessory protein, partial [Streptomyces scabiei]